MKFKNVKDVILPLGSIVHHEENFDAITVPVDGFQKLVAYKTPKGYWVHKDYRTEPKKSKKK